MQMLKNIVWSKAKVSPPGKYNKADVDGWLNNALWFTIPVAIFYLQGVISVIEQPNHVFALTDFLPSNATVISMIYYILSRLTDALRRLVKGK